jgi:putative flippase GtrA
VHLSSRILKFGLAGGIGFFVDAGVLMALLWGGLDPVLARCFSIACALVSTWLVNRSLAFADRAPSRPSLPEFLRYVSASLVALLVNFGIYWLLFRWGGIFAQWPVLALVAGTGVSMCVNFISYFKVVFARKH